MFKQLCTNGPVRRAFSRVLPLMAVCGLFLAARVEAQTQVSGSMPIQPSAGQSPPSDVLHENQTITMDVFLCNTSSFNGSQADVRVTGTTRVAMACSDTTCIAQDGSTNAATEGAQFTFDSCVGVTDANSTELPTCALGLDPDIVNITYPAGGKLIPKSTTQACTKIATITAHAEPGQQVLNPANGAFLAVGVTGVNNLFLVQNPGVRKETGGSAPFYYPGICGDGTTQTILGFCCGSPASEANCDKQFACNSNADCSNKLCCDANGNCNNATTCNSSADCFDPNFTTCTAPPGTTCLLEQCDDGNNVNTDGCNNICQPLCEVSIDKTVAKDDDCNGTADSAFSDSVTQDSSKCVVYKICVNNTGAQDLTGVMVTDTGPPGGPGGTLDFGTVAAGTNPCQLIPTSAAVGACTGGSCVCSTVQGQDTATITSATCSVTSDSACAQATSDCTDTANVSCESCGDGIVQPGRGEECDDGNSTPFDGCGIPGGGENNCKICPNGTPCGTDQDATDCKLPACGPVNGVPGFCLQCQVADANKVDQSCSSNCGTAVNATECNAPVCTASGDCVNKLIPSLIGQAGCPTTQDQDTHDCKLPSCVPDQGNPTTAHCQQCQINTNENNACSSNCDVPVPPTECNTPICHSGVCANQGDQSQVGHVCPTTPDQDTSDCLLPTCQITNNVGSCVQCSTPDQNKVGQACSSNCNSPVQGGGNGGTDCANPILGSATGCTVLELDGSKVDINGPNGGLIGDVCIGPNGKLAITGEESVQGNIRLASGAKFSKSGKGTVSGQVLTNQDLSAEIADCTSASTDSAALPCGPKSVDTLSGTQTINASPGVNVICVKNVNVGNKQTITLHGNPGDSFVFNVSGSFKINGGKIVVSGIGQKDVLYNVIGTGEQVAFTGGGGGTGCCNAAVDGTLVALSRNIALSPGLVNGQLCGGKDISIVSGSSVQCVPGNLPECASTGVCQ